MTNDLTEQRAEAEQSGDSLPWRGAYEALKVRGLRTGISVRTKELYLMMGIPLVPTRKAGEGDAEFVERGRLWSLTQFHPQLSLLADRLLEVHGLYLATVGPGTYEARNAEAAPEVARRAVARMRRAMTHGATVLGLMNDDGLTDEQRTAHADARARIARLRGMVEGD